MLHQLISAFQTIKRFDQRRPGVPGEHFAAASAGTALLTWGRRARSPALRAATMLAGGVLLWRAASGRDGISKLRR